MPGEIEGRAHVVGDDIDTDLLAPGAYMKQPVEELARHCLEGIDPQFALRVKNGDVLLAGRNFGIGSSREQAAQALKILGFAAIVARSFSGIFYRNALNIGLLAVVCSDYSDISTGDVIRLNPRAGRLEHPASGRVFACRPLPAHLLEMVEAGGIVPWLARRVGSANRRGIQ